MTVTSCILPVIQVHNKKVDADDASNKKQLLIYLLLIIINFPCRIASLNVRMPLRNTLYNDSKSFVASLTLFLSKYGVSGLPVDSQA